MAGSEGPAPGPDPADPAPPTAATDDDGLACAICLLPLPPDAPDVAHVDCPAWHRLHAACARRWTAAQLASSRGGPPRLRCPLCSRPYASLVLPCGDSGAVVEAAVPGAGSARVGVCLTPAERARREVYRWRREVAGRGVGEGEGQDGPGVAPVPAPQPRLPPRRRAAALAWLARDLRALLLVDDVSLIAQAILGAAAGAGGGALVGGLAAAGSPATRAAWRALVGPTHARRCCQAGHEPGWAARYALESGGKQAPVSVLTGHNWSRYRMGRCEHRATTDPPSISLLHWLAHSRCHS